MFRPTVATDLTKINNYVHHAPPCTMCQATHDNFVSVEIEGGWAYLCDACRAKIGLGEYKYVGKSIGIVPTTPKKRRTQSEVISDLF